MFIKLGEALASIATGETLAAKIIKAAKNRDGETQTIISRLADSLRELPISLFSYGFSPTVKCEIKIREFLFSFTSGKEKNIIPYYGLSLSSPNLLEHISLSCENNPILIQSIHLTNNLWRITAGHICLELSIKEPEEIRLPEKVKELQAAQIGFKKIGDKTIV